MVTTVQTQVFKTAGHHKFHVVLSHIISHTYLARFSLTFLVTRKRCDAERFSFVFDSYSPREPDCPASQLTTAGRDGPEGQRGIVGLLTFLTL
ncbi:hypothetical protein CEE69_01270 [Rhodopirellula bahusiensis]|uniref:Uncharacterized protein n=1 Tax=Rhodopirellula bahusiensis TaxID=2014065 RepID=A0A2G1WDY3_9BACT|nr:hypothetical protein CEE69_01270 [Rhodopirellula bahusiensis]